MINNSLQKASTEVLQQLVIVIQQIENLQYTETLRILSENSIGKHTRHIIEFFECVFKSIHTGVVAYDARERNLQLETSKSFAIHTIQNLTDTITRISSDQSISLHLSMDTNEPSLRLTSTLYREMVYTIEHAIHHMAIIRMAIQNAGWPVVLPEHFGVAYSTVSYKKHSVD